MEEPHELKTSKEEEDDEERKQREEESQREIEDKTIPKKAIIKTKTKARILYIVSWIWFILGAVITGLVLVFIHGKSLTEGREFLATHPYLFVFIELVSAGMLQLLFTFIAKDPWKKYGFTLTNIGKSIIPSVIGIIVFWGIDWIITGSFWNIQTIEHNLGLTGRIIYGLLGLIIWGPLEVFFFIWLVENAQGFFKKQEDNKLLNKWLNPGFLLTLFLFSLAHFITTQNWVNVGYIFVIFLILGEVYLHTGNILGPMIAWTLINDQVWFMLQLLWLPSN